MSKIASIFSPNMPSPPPAPPPPPPPPPPPAPPPPPPAPSEEPAADDIAVAKDTESKTRRVRRGRAATIVNEGGAQGDLGVPNVNRPSARGGSQLLG